ncbi:MAG: LPXTG cell wall anchor domain-containing protein, partial [Oribacterium sp.]|nr:LPXTG cell wall anchor domain-containing protein [Oribacterium sp.]
ETPDNSGDSGNGSSGSSSGGSGSGSGGGSGSSGSTGIHSVFGDSRNTTTESKAGSTTESAAGTPPDDSNPVETTDGSVQGMNRNRLGKRDNANDETAGASRSVQTGDHAHMILYLAVSLIALIGLFGWKRKAEKQG